MPTWRRTTFSWVIGFTADGVRGARRGRPLEEVVRRLIEEARAAGAGVVEIETTHEDGDAWIRAGFTETARVLEAPIDALEEHLGAHREPSFGSIHVQTDDVDGVVRAVRQFVPRLPGGSRGARCSAAGRLDVGVRRATDREPEMLRRLGREISDRMGAFVLAMGVEEGRVVRYVALERGRVVDEYLSVPEHYGQLPPGEVIALGANPRLMARLTGADADAVRATARTGRSPEELPAADEMLAELARLFGVPQAAHGYPGRARGRDRRPQGVGSGPAAAPSLRRSGLHEDAVLPHESPGPAEAAWSGGTGRRPSASTSAARSHRPFLEQDAAVDAEARPVERRLRVERVVDERGDELDVGLRLDEPAHDAERPERALAQGIPGMSVW